MTFWDTAFAHWLTVGLMAWSFILVLKWTSQYMPIAPIKTLMTAA